MDRDIQIGILTTLKAIQTAVETIATNSSSGGGSDGGGSDGGGGGESTPASNVSGSTRTVKGGSKG